jgi:uncharacterized protein (DUF2236 family)
MDGEGSGAEARSAGMAQVEAIVTLMLLVGAPAGLWYAWRRWLQACALRRGRPAPQLRLAPLPTVSQVVCWPAPAPVPLIPGRLFTPDRRIWTVDRETVLLLGAGRALLLQFAHPLVAAGVAEHSAFAQDRLGRLRRTLDMSYALVFGDLGTAQAAVRRMDTVHARVRGVLREAVGRFPAGTPYDAMDPELRLWVHATLIDTSLVVYQRFVAPLTHAQEAEYWADSCAVAQLLGIPESMIPTTLDDFRAYVARTLTRDVAVGPATRTLARRIFHPGAAMLVPAVAFLKLVTVGLLPPEVRRQYGYRWSRGRARLLDAFAAAVRAALPAMPRVLRVAPAARAIERSTRAPLRRSGTKSERSPSA